MTEASEQPDTPYPSVHRGQTRRGGLADDIASYIRDLILTGALRPGEKLDQEAVAAALGVSRSPIREALVVLGQEGLLDLTPRRGAFVADLTYQDIVDHYELFGLVSGRAAGFAAVTLSDEELDELTAMHERFEKASDDELSDLNNQFHRLINKAAPRRTRWLIRHLDRSVPANYYEFADGWNTQAVEGHGLIVAAITSRDVDASRRAMERHLHEGGIAAADSLRAAGFWEGRAT